MDFQVEHANIAINEVVYEGGAEQPVDCEITLPDYCPDIARVLKCVVTPRVFSNTIIGDRVTVEGTTVVKLYYVDDGGRNVRCFEQVSPFSRSVDMGGSCEQPSAFVSAKVSYVNCRAINQRRADVHGAVSLQIKVTAQRQEQVLVSASGMGIQLKSKSLGASSVVGEAERCFTVDEVVELGQSQPTVQSVLRSGATIILQDYKIIANKILLKGDVMVRTLYCADNKEEDLASLEQSFPFSQILDLDGVEETSICDVRLSVAGLEVTPKADINNELRLLDVSTRIRAELHACEEKNICIIKDAYSTQFELETENKVLEFSSLLEHFEDTFLAKSTLDLSETGMTGVIDLWCGDKTAMVKPEGDSMVISGTVTLCMLIFDKDRQPSFCERVMDYEYRHKLPEACESIKCDPWMDPQQVDYSISADGGMEVRVSFAVSASVFVPYKEELITSVTPIETQEKKGVSAALTIYFCDSGETVWDIARRYNTTVEAVLQENDLSEDVIHTKRMLLIPGM